MATDYLGPTIPADLLDDLDSPCSCPICVPPEPLNDASLDEPGQWVPPSAQRAAIWPGEKTVEPCDESYETILEEAQRLVYGARKAEYGDARGEAEKLAAGWSVILGVDVPPEKCALLMVWLKVVRQCNKPKRDNLVDGAGYFGVAEKVERGL